MDFVNFKKSYFALALILLFLGAAALMGFGFLPVLKVNGRAASYAEFSEVYGALKTFESVSAGASGGADAAPALEFKRLALADLVDNLLLNELISKSAPELFQKAESMAEEVLKDEKNASLGEASRRIYGLGLRDFKKFVLLPQAKRDALTEYYRGDEEKLSKIWLGLRKNAEVKIYYPGYFWDGEDVRIKN